MSYTTKDFKSKKELKEAFARGEEITIYNPGLGEAPTEGIASIEGPHYPKPHTWYASVKVENGIVVKILN